VLLFSSFICKLKFRYRILLLPIYLVISNATIYSQTQFEKDYRVRCDSVLYNFSSPDAPRNLFSVLAKYACGKEDSSTSVLLDSLLKYPKGDMFWMYPVTGIYFYGRKNLSTVQKNKIINSFAHYPADTGVTENHKLMFYTSLFLMSGEDEMDTIHWINKVKSSCNHKNARYMLNAWMNKAFASGFTEFNSPHYGGFYLSPLLMLYDFSKDTGVRTHAGILLWRILGDYVTHYHCSVITGACSRVVDEDIFNKENSAMAKLMGFILGDKPANANYHSLYFAVSSFKFPELLYTIWKEEQKHDFDETDKERNMSKIKFSDGKTNEITSYLFSDSAFSLGSVMDGYNDEIQTRTWSLDWTSNGENNTLFGLNPFISKTALAAYFPGDIDTTYKNILKQRPFYNDTNKWIGGSPYENLFQHKNVLLGIYNFPDTLVNNSVSFFISDNIDSLITEGNILFAKSNGIYFALRLSEKAIVSKVQYGYRYRIRSRKPGFVLEVYPAGVFKSIDDFVNDIKGETVSFSAEDIIFKSNDSTQMQLFANGKKLLDGKSFALPADLMYKSPFMNISNGIMSLETMHEKAIFDWNKQQIIYLKN
jgi:hypothetical protein